MILANVPKKGRARSEQEEGKKVVVFLPSQDKAAGTRVTLTTTPVCTEPMDPAAKTTGHWTRRSRRTTNKRAAGTKCPEELLSERADQGEKPPLPPLMKRGAGRDTGARKRNPGRFADAVPLLKLPQKQVKAKSHASNLGEMTPWVRPSPSESSLTTLLCSVPSPRTCAGNLDPPQSPHNPAPTQAICSSSRTAQSTLLRENNPSRAKPRSRAGLTKRWSLRKFHSIKLPPVPTVTELSFSRNFSFSFFELPEHQTPHQWLQRQRGVYMMMRQLQY
ncbi:uncharacterized protein O3C94_015095 [Discoglossus pictus]